MVTNDELIEIAKQKYNIGDVVSNKNLGINCQFTVSTLKFSFSNDSNLLIESPSGASFYTVYSQELNEWADIISSVPLDKKSKKNKIKLILW